MFNVLITSASRKISLVRSFEKALDSLSLDGSVYIADASPLAPSLYKSCNSIISPRTDEKGYLKWLIDFCSKHQIKLIIPTRDEELIIFAHLKDDFMNKGIYINISSVETIKICNDKKIFYEYCRANGIPIPNIFNDIRSVEYPCFIKGRYGKGSRFAFKITDQNQLNAFLAISEDFIMQEYIDWPEYTIDYFADYDGNPISVVPRNRILTFGGESFVGKTVNNRFIIEETINFARGLNLVGHNTIQLFYNDKNKELKFMEINARYGGGAALGIAAGANSPLFLIQLVLGQPVEHGLYDFEEDVYMFRYTEDIFVKGNGVKK